MGRLFCDPAGVGELGDKAILPDPGRGSLLFGANASSLSIPVMWPFPSM